MSDESKDIGEEPNADSSPGEALATARRKILRTLVAGGGAITAAKVAPEQWVKPVVDSVVLPTHATTSGPGAGPGGAAGDFASGTVSTAGTVARNIDTLLANQPLSDDLLEFFIPSSSAGDAMAGCSSNTSCDVNFTLFISPDFTSGSVCVEGDSMGMAGLSGVTENGFAGSNGPVGDFDIDDGIFSSGQWSFEALNLVTNTVTQVSLSSSNVPGCRIP